MYTCMCTHTHTDPEADNEACRMLKVNAQNLMSAISEVLYATDSAIILSVEGQTWFAVDQVQKAISEYPNNSL